MQFLKRAAPYFLAAILSVGIFAAGLWTGIDLSAQISANAAASVFAPKRSTELVSQLNDTQRVLSLMDAGNFSAAHAQLETDENLQLIELDRLAPLMDQHTAQVACRLIQSVAKHRAEHTGAYSRGQSDLARMSDDAVSDVLTHPDTCERNGKLE